MDEKKEYSVIGTVTIGTDEYRDLLTERFEAIKEKEEYNNKWYEQYRKVKELEDQNVKLKEELDKLKSFIKKNSVNINEDSITLFMSMFGEE